MKLINLTVTGLISALMLLASINCLGASMCNPDGADPTICKSQHGKYEIFVHPRFFWGDISHNGFCDSGYLKIAGVELNGPAYSGAPASPALGMTQSTTSTEGMNVKPPDSSKTISVSSAIYFAFNSVAMKLLKDQHLNYGEVLVSLDKKTAAMYLVNDMDKVSTIHLTCNGN